MDIKVLHTFIAVARQGSFAAAARRADVDPSLVSRSIAGLEKELGIRLFQRNTRQMTLTEAGEVYLNRVEAVIDELADAREESFALSSGPKGTLRMTASVAFGQTCIVPLIADFRSAFPDVELELMLTDENLDLVANRIDLAIRLAPSLGTDMICAKLLDTHYRVCASPGYLSKSLPVHRPEDISDHDSLLLALPEFRTRWLFRNADGKISTIPVKGGIVISNALAIRESMLAGLGPALLANWLIGDDIANGRCMDIFPDYEVTATSFDTGAWLIYPSRAFLPNKVRVAIDFLRQHLAGKKSSNLD